MPTHTIPQSAALTLQRLQPKNESGVCRDCGAALAAAESFSENSCGAFCEMCFLLHVVTCGDLTLDLDEIYGAGCWSATPAQIGIQEMTTPSLTVLDDEHTYCMDCEALFLTSEVRQQKDCGWFCPTCLSLHRYTCWSCSGFTDDDAPSHVGQVADPAPPAARAGAADDAAPRTPAEASRLPLREAKQLSLF